MYKRQKHGFVSGVAIVRAGSFDRAQTQDFAEGIEGMAEIAGGQFGRITGGELGEGGG